MTKVYLIILSLIVWQTTAESSMLITSPRLNELVKKMNKINHELLCMQQNSLKHIQKVESEKACKSYCNKLRNDQLWDAQLSYNHDKGRESLLLNLLKKYPNRFNLDLLSKEQQKQIMALEDQLINLYSKGLGLEPDLDDDTTDTVIIGN